MSGINERRDAMDARIAQDSEYKFKVHSLRNRLLGGWAAALMGMTPEASADYAKSVVVADFEEAGDDDVLRKVWADLAAHGLPTGEAEVRTEMDRLLGVAAEQLAAQE